MLSYVLCVCICGYIMLHPMYNSATHPTYFHLSTEMAKPLAYICLVRGIVGWFLSLKLCASLANMTTNTECNSMKSILHLNTCRSAFVFESLVPTSSTLFNAKRKQEMQSSAEISFLAHLLFLGATPPEGAWRAELEA